MYKIVRFFRRWWWAFLLGAAIVLSVLWKLMGLRSSVENVDEGPLKPPSFSDRARNEVEKVRLEGEIEKARVKVRADEQKKVIDNIEEKGKVNPAKAREEIAEWLASNL